MPWKREDDKEDNGVIQQTEFPSWANNKEYLAYNSPSATFLGKFFFIRFLRLVQVMQARVTFLRGNKKKVIYKQ